MNADRLGKKAPHTTVFEEDAAGRRAKLSESVGGESASIAATTTPLPKTITNVTEGKQISRIWCVV